MSDLAVQLARVEGKLDTLQVTVEAGDNEIHQLVLSLREGFDARLGQIMQSVGENRAAVRAAHDRLDKTLNPDIPTSLAGKVVRLQQSHIEHDARRTGWRQAIEQLRPWIAPIVTTVAAGLVLWQAMGAQ